MHNTDVSCDWSPTNLLSSTYILIFIQVRWTSEQTKNTSTLVGTNKPQNQKRRFVGDDGCRLENI